MKIESIKTTPLYCELKEPYHWSQGINAGAEIVLVEVEVDNGVTGIGEVPGGPDNRAKLAVIDYLKPLLVGAPAYEPNRLATAAYQAAFASRGSGSSPRYFAQCFAGIEMALWDAIGKDLGQPLHRILGGAVRERIEYFGFVQGDTSEQLVESATNLVKAGFEVFYLKVGRGMEADLRNVKAVRNAIGDRRLRLDANEMWDILTARRMLNLFEPFSIEMVEQPLPATTGPASMNKLRASASIPIAADQAVFSVAEVYDFCRSDAADLIVIGLHEVGGIGPMRKAAAIAEAAGLNICNHGVFETGITTCAVNQVAATIPNLDDGNQIMCQLLVEDIVSGVDLAPANGSLPIGSGPGLGFELNWDAVERAARAYNVLHQGD